jgi:hypothetical protein
MTRSKLLLACLGGLACVLLVRAAGVPGAAPAGGTPLRIVFGSGCAGAYSIRPDASRLTPLTPRSRSLEPETMSRDGTTVVYINSSRSIYASRASGSRLRRIASFTRYGIGEMALSRDGRLLAFSNEGIRIVGTDGRGLRKLSTGRDDDEPNWSPDGKMLVFTHSPVKNSSVILLPLHGRGRVLAGQGEAPAWSPNGRWIAYVRERSKSNELWVVRPDGSQRHRVATDAAGLGWAPDSRQIAFSGFSHGLRVIGVDGRGLRRLGPPPFYGGRAAPSWSLDGHLIAFAKSDNGGLLQLFVVRRDGKGLRQLTSDCGANVFGWTRLAPVLPPDPPTERVLGAQTLATRDPVEGISADGGRVAIIAHPAPTNCEHVAVWTPDEKAVGRFATPRPCRQGESGGSYLYGVELAGTRAAWVSAVCGNFCDTEVRSASLEAPAPVKINRSGSFANGDKQWDYQLHGDGGLFVFVEGTRLVRIGVGNEHCGDRDNTTASICTTLRRGAGAAPVDSVSAGLIAVRNPGEVAVLDEHGAVVRSFPFVPADVSVARLDAGHLVVARLGVIEKYDVASGLREVSRPLPAGYTLTDVDGGIAVLRHDRSIMLLRLDDGRSMTLTPQRGPVFAELEPAGLYYTYTTADGSGRVVLLRRSDLVQQLK